MAGEIVERSRIDVEIRENRPKPDDTVRGVHVHRRYDISHDHAIRSRHVRRRKESHDQATGLSDLQRPVRRTSKHSLRSSLHPALHVRIRDVLCDDRRLRIGSAFRDARLRADRRRDGPNRRACRSQVELGSQRTIGTNRSAPSENFEVPFCIRVADLLRMPGYS